MNVIICNQKKDLLTNLNIDIIKTVEGQYSVDEIIEMFKNFYYQRMILDITAIKEYDDIKNLQKLSISLDMDKLILLLDDNEESGSPNYLSKLISMGIYNFTRNAEGVLYLYNNPNSYRDVAQYHQLDDGTDGQIIYQGVEADYCRVIGVKNLTDDGGATTFCYMMVKQLKKNYKVVGVEVDANDFNYFTNKSLHSISSKDLGKFIEKNNDCDVIIVDVNKSPIALGLVQEIIYLVEPSTIKLNRLMNIKRNVFKELSGRKVILNKSLLSSKDVLELQYEARAKFFFNMPPLNERDANINIMDTFLSKMGFLKQQTEETEKRKKILGLF